MNFWGYVVTHLEEKKINEKNNYVLFGLDLIAIELKTKGSNLYSKDMQK